MQSKFPPELNAFFRNMETNSNPWGIGFAKRAEWGEALGVRPIKDVPGAEYLFWVGCMGAFDDAGKGIAAALVKILRAAGSRSGRSGPRRSAAAIRPGASATNIFSKAWPRRTSPSSRDTA